ncbi:MAG: poly-gamma-glutamate biosynthesis protein PgsC [Candidatus Aminicenantaceae bacterium]
MLYETLVIGLIVSVLYTEWTDIFPGGIIVPAYMAFYMDQPLKVLMTIFIAVLSLMTYKFLSRFLILFGKRRFVMFILIGIFWSQLWFLIQPPIFHEPLGLETIGWIIPGLLANNLERQNFLLTLASLLTTSVLIYFMVRTLSGFGVLPW